MPRIVSPTGKPLTATKPEEIAEEIGKIFVREQLTIDECAQVLNRLLFSVILNGATTLEDLTEFGNGYLQQLNAMMNQAAAVITGRGNVPPEQQN